MDSVFTLWFSYHGYLVWGLVQILAFLLFFGVPFSFLCSPINISEENETKNPQKKNIKKMELDMTDQQKEFCAQVFDRFDLFLKKKKEEEKKEKILTKKVLNRALDSIKRDVSRILKIYVGKDVLRRWYHHQLYEKTLKRRHRIFEMMTVYNNVRGQSGVLPLTICLDGRELKSCAYNCSFCPNETKANGAAVDMARSYLSNEAVPKIAMIEDFDAVRQVLHRAILFQAQGETVQKIELIFLGGTWHSFPQEYRDRVVHDVYYACNLFFLFSLHDTKAQKGPGEFYPEAQEWVDKHHRHQKSICSVIPLKEIQKRYPRAETLEQEKARNETSSCPVISIVLETRPDQCVSRENLLTMRKGGSTKLQLGVQQLDDAILNTNNRMHTVKDTAEGLKNAVNAGFKISGHLMLDLPGSTSLKDRELFEKVTRGTEFQLDAIKIYTCQRVPFTLAERWFQRGKHLWGTGQTELLEVLEFQMQQGIKMDDHVKVWRPRSEYDFQQLFEDHIYALQQTMPWTREERVIRDFAEGTEKNGFLGFMSDNLTLDLRQRLTQEMESRGIRCFDIRAREVGEEPPEGYRQNVRFYIRRYENAGGIEFFLSAEVPNSFVINENNKDDAVLLGLVRLRIPPLSFFSNNHKKDNNDKKVLLNEFCMDGKRVAIIREVHVYGHTVAVHQKDQTGVGMQHSGIGSFLIQAAEVIARNCYHSEKLVVISGVGVRNFYRKHGFEKGRFEDGDYMVKTLSPSFSFSSFYDDKKTFRLLDRVYTSTQISDAAHSSYETQSFPNFPVFTYGERCPHASLVIL